MEIVIILYSQKYWRGLNSVVGPKIAIATVLVDLSLAVWYSTGLPYVYCICQQVISVDFNIIMDTKRH